VKRKLLASVFTAKSMRKTLEQSAASKEKQREEKRRILREKLKQGVAGQRFGKHTVQKAKIDVQLGEDLTDSLRGLKVSSLAVSILSLRGLEPILHHAAGRELV
jgi:nucleolar protein 53